MTTVTADVLQRAFCADAPDTKPLRCWWGPKMPGAFDQCYVPAQTDIGLCLEHYEEVIP
jgi:hypothetical protein